MMQLPQAAARRGEGLHHTLGRESPSTDTLDYVPRTEGGQR